MKEQRTASAVKTIQLGNCGVSGIADSADFSRDRERERRKEKKNGKEADGSDSAYFNA